MSLPEASDLNLRDGYWHMMTVTYRNGSQHLYVDGVLVASGTYSGQLPLIPNVVAIGGVEEFGPYHHPWIGDIDEVSIYNRVLEPSEVTALWSAIAPNGPVIDNITPTNDYNTADASVQMQIVAHSPASVAQVTVNGNAAQDSGNNTWSYIAPLSVGLNVFTVIVTDMPISP